MSNRKAAALKIEMFSLACPHCGEPLFCAPNGSSLFSVHDPIPAELLCEACGKVSAPPAKAARLNA